jgi:hypothetical protein
MKCNEEEKRVLSLVGGVISVCVCWMVIPSIERAQHICTNTHNTHVVYNNVHVHIYTRVYKTYVHNMCTTHTHTHALVELIAAKVRCVAKEIPIIIIEIPRIR